MPHRRTRLPRDRSARHLAAPTPTKPGVRLVALALALAITAFGCDGLFGTGDGGPDASVGEECEVASECPDPYVCAGGRCQPEGETGLGGSCWAHRDCEPGLYCSPQARCAPAGEGDEGAVCGSGGECRADLRCHLDGLSGLCREGGEGDVGESCEIDTACLPGLVCGGEGVCAHPEQAYPPWEGVSCAESEGPFRVHFDLSAEREEFFRLPFPTDARWLDSGELDLEDFPRPGPQALGIDFVDRYADALAEDFAGFSPTAAVTLGLSEELGEAPEGALRFVHVTEGAPDFGEAVQHEWRYEGEGNRYRCPDALIAEPEPGVLRPGHTYAVYATTDLSSAAGEAAVPAEDFAAVLSESAPGDPDRERAWEAHAPFRAYLDGPGPDPSEVVGAAVFTVQDGPDRVRSVAEATAEGDPPPIEDLAACGEGEESPCAGGDRGCVGASEGYEEIHGRIGIPRYQEGEPPFENPSDGGAIRFEEDGEPIRRATDGVCFSLAVPEGEPPADGWPLVVYGHGTGGDFRSAMAQGVAENLASADAPMAVLSFDGVAHGDRAGDSDRSPEALMFNVGNPRAARDNHAQGAADIVAALRAAESPIDAGPLGDVELDPERAFVFGHSQGGQVGVPALAVTDLAGAAVISGTGAHLAEALLGKTSPVDARRGLERLAGDELAPDHPVMILWQTFFDPVDPATFAPHLVERPLEGLASVHLLMTYGPGDTFTPPASLAAMARAAGLPVAEPALEELGTGLESRPVDRNLAGGDGEDRTAACFQYGAEGFDGHFVATRSGAAIEDWVEFLVTAQETAPAVGEREE